MQPFVARVVAGLAVVLALAQPAHAADGEHDEAALDHDSALGTAHLHRPTSPTAEHLMASLRCMCPGCQAQRVSILACKCDFAAQQRADVEGALASADLSTAAGRRRAEAAVLGAAVARYGRFVLGTPGSSWAWAAPAGAAGGGLAIILLLGLRWVRRGRVASSGEAVLHDDELEDRLDDELRAFD
jgi:cytochrome c-type biogenesis protein CcmH/NrfF